MPTTRRIESGDPVAEMTNGLIIADAAIILAIRLESLGHVLTVEDGLLKVSHGATLTAEDRASIQRYRWQLLAIAGWSEP